MRARPSQAQSIHAAYPALVIGHSTTKLAPSCKSETIISSQRVRLPAYWRKAAAQGASTPPYPPALPSHRIQKLDNQENHCANRCVVRTPRKLVDTVALGTSTPPYPVLLGHRPTSKPTQANNPGRSVNNLISQQGRADLVVNRSGPRLSVAAKKATAQVTATVVARSTSAPRVTDSSASSRASTPRCTPRAREGTLELGVLRLGDGRFDPALPHIRSQLLAALGASQSCSITASEGFSGGMNAGIWFMGDGKDQLVLKLVKFDPNQPAQFVEADSFQELYRDIPELASDASVAFPFKILKILGSRNSRQHDLIVMRRVPGKSLDRVIFDHKQDSKMSDLKDVFKRVAECLCNLHLRYGGRQHSDAGPQNIFYDEATKQVKLIDIGFMGVKTRKTDIEHFSGAIERLAAVSYGAELLEALPYFELGYAEAKAKALALDKE